MEEKLMLNFTKCPNCEGEKRLSDEVLQKQIAAGKMSVKSVSFLYQHQSIIAGPVGTWLSAPAILSFFDVCMDCGTVYCIHAEVQTVVQGGKPKAGGQFSVS